MFEQLILISSALVGGADGTVELPLDDAMSKIDAQLLAYCSEEGIPFDLNSRVRPIYDDVGNVIGFRTNIGEPELSFDLAGYSIDLPQANEAPEYYSSSLAGMTMLSDLASFNLR